MTQQQQDPAHWRPRAERVAALSAYLSADGYAGDCTYEAVRLLESACGCPVCDGEGCSCCVGFDVFRWPPV
jgi:hypothetical protein